MNDGSDVFFAAYFFGMLTLLAALWGFVRWLIRTWLDSR